MKKFAFAAAALALIATPAFAATTIENVIAKGVTIDIAGMTLEINYKPDGTFDGGQFQGTYKVDGKKLCLDVGGQANCTEYPEGKGPGDSFTVPSDFGDMKITIKK